MAVPKSAKAPALGSGLVVGGFCLFGLILLAIAATIILSLISTYNANRSQQGYGDGYRINALGLKSVYTNISSTFTNNNSIVVNRDLSNACGSLLYSIGQKYLAGCVINPHNVIRSGLQSPSIRRKRDINAEIISVATATVYYTNTCGKLADKGKYVNDTSLSSCVKQRLRACNQLYNNSLVTTSNITSWPLSSPIAYTILSDDRLSYIFATVSAVAGIQPAALLASYGSSLSATTQAQLSAGCQYTGPISLNDIAAILAAQNGLSYTTTSYTG